MKPYRELAYSELSISEELSITKIVSLFYFEFDKYRIVPEESHACWELVYVDKGDVLANSDKQSFNLKQGDIIFYKPYSVHSGQANSISAPNVIVLAFHCNSSVMDYFGNKSFQLLDEERDILAHIVKEGMCAYEPIPIPEVSPTSSEITVIKRKKDQLFGSEQMMKIHLETLLIYLLRRNNNEESKRVSSLVMDNKKEQIYKEFNNYFDDQPDWAIKIQDLCKKLYVNINLLKQVIYQKTGRSVKEHISKLRIDKAKKLMREYSYNFTEISELLGYNNVHYFSKHFKQVSNMTPSEYSRTAKARIGDTDI